MNRSNENVYHSATQVTAAKTQMQAVLLITAPFMACIGILGSLPWIAS